MKKLIKPPIKEAACVSAQTAEQSKPHTKEYCYCSTPSREKLKEQIGRLLLYLQTPLPENERWNYWRVFESGLRRYIDLKLCEVKL